MTKHTFNVWYGDDLTFEVRSDVQRETSDGGSMTPACVNAITIHGNHARFIDTSIYKPWQSRTAYHTTPITVIH
jgi:hypothetical protein